MFPIYFSTRPKQLQELQVALDKGAAVLDANSWSQRIEHCRNNRGRGGQNASKDVRFEAQIVFFNKMIEVEIYYLPRHNLLLRQSTTV